MTRTRTLRLGRGRTASWFSGQDQTREEAISRCELVAKKHRCAVEVVDHEGHVLYKVFAPVLIAV